MTTPQSVNDWTKVDLDKVIIIKGEMRPEAAEILAREEEKVVFLLPEGCELLDTEPVKALVTQARATALQEAMEVLQKKYDALGKNRNDYEAGYEEGIEQSIVFLEEFSALNSLAKE